MCTLSYVGDWWRDTAPVQYPNVFPQGGSSITIAMPPTREEFDALKRDVEALHQLLLAAKGYDEATGQPDCETDEKVALIKAVAEMMGVDMSDVFGDN